MLVVSTSPNIKHIGRYRDLILVGQDVQTNNEALEYFLKKDFDFICFVNSDHIQFQINPIVGPMDIISEFRESYAHNKFPVQSAFTGQVGNRHFIGEDDFVYLSMKPSNVLIFASRLAVESVGMFDNCLRSLKLWQMRISASAGYFPQQFCLLKRAYKYINIRDADRFLKEQERNDFSDTDYLARKDEIYRGIDLKIPFKETVTK